MDKKQRNSTISPVRLGPSGNKKLIRQRTFGSSSLSPINQKLGRQESGRSGEDAFLKPPGQRDTDDHRSIYSRNSKVGTMSQKLNHNESKD